MSPNELHTGLNLAPDLAKWDWPSVLLAAALRVIMSLASYGNGRRVAIVATAQAAPSISSTRRRIACAASSPPPPQTTSTPPSPPRRGRCMRAARGPLRQCWIVPQSSIARPPSWRHSTARIEPRGPWTLPAWPACGSARGAGAVLASM